MNEQHAHASELAGASGASPLERFARLRERFLPALTALLDEVVLEASGAGSPLAEMCRYHLGTGGKRLRALLPLAVSDALASEPAALLPFAAACEMLHNATLVHDDVQDGDRVRRGQPTVWARFGTARAVNLGDAMFYYALLCLERLAGPAERRERVALRLLRQTLRVIDGQEQEIRLGHAAEPSVADYVAMVEGKTSGLFALPMAGAAELCGCAPALVDALAEAARDLGVLFQVQDDLLDLYGEKGRERRGNDLREGKRSLLAIHALQQAAPEERAELRAILDRSREDTSDDDVERASAILDHAGAPARALELIAERRRRAVAQPGLQTEPRLVALVEATAELLLEPISSLLPRGRLAANLP
jgi:geranylgeranyl pyrophosphate synthase